MAEEMEDFLSEEETETSGTESEVSELLMTAAGLRQRSSTHSSGPRPTDSASNTTSNTTDVEKQQEAIRKLSQLKNEECEIFKYLDKNLQEALESRRGADQVPLKPVGKGGQKPVDKPPPPPPPPPSTKSEFAPPPPPPPPPTAMLEAIRISTISTVTRVSTAPPPDDPAWGGYPLRQLMPVLYAGGFWLVYCANAMRAFVPVP